MKKQLALATLALAFVAGGSWFLNRPAPESGLLPGAALAQEASGSGDTTAADESDGEAAADQADGESAEIDTSTVTEMTMGDEDAPVTLTEYAAYTCPHCRDFNQSVLPELKSDYIDTGKVKLVYREFYLNQAGLWASMITRCGDNTDRFFGITDMLYEKQQEWLGDGNPQTIADNLRKMGRTAGIGEDQLQECLTDATKAQTLVAWVEENAEADNVNSTPTFLIDGEKFEGDWSADLLPAIDDALGE